MCCTREKKRKKKNTCRAASARCSCWTSSIYIQGMYVPYIDFLYQKKRKKKKKIPAGRHQRVAVAGRHPSPQCGNRAAAALMAPV